MCCPLLATLATCQKNLSFLSWQLPCSVCFIVVFMFHCFTNQTLRLSSCTFYKSFFFKPIGKRIMNHFVFMEVLKATWENTYWPLDGGNRQLVSESLGKRPIARLHNSYSIEQLSERWYFRFILAFHFYVREGKFVFLGGVVQSFNSIARIKLNWSLDNCADAGGPPKHPWDALLLSHCQMHPVTSRLVLHVECRTGGYRMLLQNKTFCQRRKWSGDFLTPRRSNWRSMRIGPLRSPPTFSLFFLNVRNTFLFLSR